MRRYRRWMAALLAAAIAASISVFPGLALPAATPFAEFQIGASSTDAPQHALSIARYTRGADGSFRLSGTEEQVCKLNRVTGDANFFIQPAEEGVWVTVDYLTDINGDGVYELLDGGSQPVWEVMDAQGGLIAPPDMVPTLTADEMYILPSELLVQHSLQAAADRLAGGAHALEGAPELSAQPEFPLCVVTLRRDGSAGGQEQVFYLRIYEDVLVPLDVSPEDPYYDAVIFCLFRGYFTGTGGGRFSPESPLTRAQLAQVLWTICGSPESEPTTFSDVPEGTWYYPAISWCQQTKLMSGQGGGAFAPNSLLTREQMAAVLYRYAQHAGSSLEAAADMSSFPDADSVSPWARDSMRWAAANWLIDIAGGVLLPKQTVTRAELAKALYAYDINLVFQSF